MVANVRTKATGEQPLGRTEAKLAEHIFNGVPLDWAGKGGFDVDWNQPNQIF